MTVEFTQDYVIIRASQGSNVKGRYVEGSTVNIDIELNWQPLSGKELLNLTELQRSKKSLKLRSEEEIRSLDEIDKTPADVVIIDGVNYEIQNVKHYDNTGLCDHYEAIAIEVNQ